MENIHLSCPTLNNFLETRQKEILALAQKNTEEIVQRENALMDFELLLSVELSDKEQQNLTSESRKLRKENWEEISKKFDGDHNKICEFIDNY